MQSLPKEIVALILEKIDKPQTFLDTICVSKEIFLLAKPLIPIKRIHFLKLVKNEHESYYALPNGKYEGPFLVIDNKTGDTLTETWYRDGQKHGTETLHLTTLGYNGKRIRFLYKIRNYKNGKLHGISQKFERDGGLIETEVYENGRRISKGSR